MTSISNIIKTSIFGLLLVPIAVLAQSNPSTQTLSVSPTLFEMNATPGQAWTSYVRVINVNDYPMTVYPQPVNFAPLGEDGRGDLIPIFSEETQGQTLAEWISVSSEPVVIPPQATKEVPLQVNVPDSAAPGGHYAAILIGTKPPTTGEQLSQVQTAQFVTALFFVRIAGDVLEAGDIREFATRKAVVQNPSVDLDMRFENTGNVHVQPQGDIKIFNMWGRERGMIPINHQTHFGNVLPQSIRKFSFSWTGDTAFYDIGRYKAVATLGYGEEGKKFVTSTTYFWVIPYMTILFILIGLFVVVKTTLWLIRRYIDRMLALSGVNQQVAPYVPLHARSEAVAKDTVVIRRYGSVAAPVKAGYIEILTSWREAIGLSQKLRAVLQFCLEHLRILVACVVVVIAVVLLTVGARGLLRDSGHYEVSINNPGADVVMSGEDIAYQTLRASYKLSEAPMTTAPIEIVNISGTVGAAAKTRAILEQASYQVTAMSVDNARREERTIIVFPPAQQETALALSKLLTGALLSAHENESETITIYAGADMASR